MKKIPFAAKMAVSILAAILLVGGAYLFSTGKLRWPLPEGSAGGGASSTAQSPAVVTPDYSQPIAFSGNLSDEIKQQLNEQLGQMQANIRANNLDLKSWLTLGTLYKIGGDYGHALMAWSFVIDTLPGGQSAYFNRADLYMNFLKQYANAEADYKKIISLNPKVVDAYQDLFYLYRDLYKTNTSAAKDILQEGLKNNPNDPQLTALLNEYTQTHAQ